MKQLLSVVILFSALFGYGQETFTVLFIKGDVLVNGEQLNRGMKLSSTDEVKYSSSDDMIAAISPSKGRVILKPQPDKAKTGGELAFVVNDIFMPVKSNAMTRAIGDDIGFANDYVVEAYFARGNFALLDTTAITFDLEEYMLDKKHNFSVRYNEKGSVEMRELPFEDNKVFLIPTELFSDGNIPNEILLVLQYSDNGDVRKVADLSVVIPNFEQLKEEIRLIKNSGIKNPWNEVSSYVESVYGFTDTSRLQAIFKSLP